MSSFSSAGPRGPRRARGGRRPPGRGGRSAPRPSGGTASGPTHSLCAIRKSQARRPIRGVVPAERGAVGAEHRQLQRLLRVLGVAHDRGAVPRELGPVAVVEHLERPRVAAETRSASRSSAIWCSDRSPEPSSGARGPGETAVDSGRLQKVGSVGIPRPPPVALAGNWRNLPHPTPPSGKTPRRYCSAQGAGSPGPGARTAQAADTSRSWGWARGTGWSRTSTSASTAQGANCLPRSRRHSSSAACRLSAELPQERWVIASQASASARMSAPSAISSAGARRGTRARPSARGGGGSSGPGGATSTASDHVGAEGGVGLHDLVVLGRQRTRREEDALRDAGLADVVHAAGLAELLGSRRRDQPSSRASRAARSATRSECPSVVGSSASIARAARRRLTMPCHRARLRAGLSVEGRREPVDHLAPMTPGAPGTSDLSPDFLASCSTTSRTTPAGRR